MTTYHIPIVNILSILTSIILTSDRDILLLGKRKGVPEDKNLTNDQLPSKWQRLGLNLSSLLTFVSKGEASVMKPRRQALNTSSPTPAPNWISQSQGHEQKVMTHQGFCSKTALTMMVRTSQESWFLEPQPAAGSWLSWPLLPSNHLQRHSSRWTHFQLCSLIQKVIYSTSWDLVPTTCQVLGTEPTLMRLTIQWGKMDSRHTHQPINHYTL